MIRRLLFSFFYRIRNILAQVLLDADEELTSQLYQKGKKLEIKDTLAKIRKFSVLGDAVSFKGSIRVSYYRNLIIGSNVHIGDNAYIDSNGGVYIGNNTHISRNVSIYSSNHNIEEALPYGVGLILKEVIIKDNVWIGMNVCVTPGVTIGEGAVVGMGAVVTKDVKDFEIVGGSPIRVLKKRDEILYSKLLNNNQIGGSNGEAIDVNSLTKANGSFLGKNLFFVLGTGRSGSTTIAKVLSQHAQLHCEHEMSKFLVKLAADYVHGFKTKEATRAILKEIYTQAKIFDKHLVFGESNHRLSLLVPILNELLPEAKFIHLVRDGRLFVDSATARGWYHNNEHINVKVRDRALMDWENFRYQADLIGEFSAESWKNLSVFGKNCWHWTYVNSNIRKALEQVADDRKRTVKLENLNDALPELQQFLSVETAPLIVKKTNISKNVLQGVNNWTVDQKLEFEKYCSQEMEQYGYN